MGSQVEGQQAAERVAGDRSPFDAKRIEQPNHVGRVVRHRVALRGGVTEATSAQIQREDAKAWAEPGLNEPVECVGVGR